MHPKPERLGLSHLVPDITIEDNVFYCYHVTLLQDPNIATFYGEVDGEQKEFSINLTPEPDKQHQVAI